MLKVSELTSRWSMAIKLGLRQHDPEFSCWLRNLDEAQREAAEGDCFTDARLALHCYVTACSSACMCANSLPVGPRWLA